MRDGGAQLEGGAAVVLQSRRARTLPSLLVFGGVGEREGRCGKAVELEPAVGVAAGCEGAQVRHELDLGAAGKLGLAETIGLGSDGRGGESVAVEVPGLE